MTGGVGRSALTKFYRDHFIFNNPDDTQLELISRTVGVDRVIDEFVFNFTHDKMIDWLYVPPDGHCSWLIYLAFLAFRQLASRLEFLSHL